MAKTAGDATLETAEDATGPNDVLLGRGYLAVKHEGNVRFRQLVKEFQEQYAAATEVTGKHDVACEVVRKIKERNGRFLRRRVLAADGQREDIGDGSDQQDSWVNVDDSIAIEKAKQTFRDLKIKAKGGSATPKARKQIIASAPAPLSFGRESSPLLLSVPKNTPQQAAVAAGLRQVKLEQQLAALQQHQRAQTEYAEREELLRSLMNQQQQQPQQQQEQQSQLQQIAPALLAVLQNRAQNSFPHGFPPAPHVGLIASLNTRTAAALQGDLRHQARLQGSTMLGGLRNQTVHEQLSSSSNSNRGLGTSPPQAIVSDYLRANRTKQCFQQPQSAAASAASAIPTSSQVATASLLLGVPAESILRDPVYAQLSLQLPNNDTATQLPSALSVPDSEAHARSAYQSLVNDPTTRMLLQQLLLQSTHFRQGQGDSKPLARVKRSISDQSPSDASGKRSKNNLIR